MGSGSFTRDSFTSYATAKCSYDSFTGKMSGRHQDIFESKKLDPALDPKNVVRECCDSAEHPLTKPVILALDVTGSMGDAATEVAVSLGNVMTKLYDKVKDIEFMTLGIGDFYYDDCPLQATQFESDIRISEQLDKIYFEFGGGGNKYESYTAAWKFGLDQTKLDCYDKRNTKAIIITIGDEEINPYIPFRKYSDVTGESVQTDISTAELYEAASKKFDIYHIHVVHGYRNERYDKGCTESFRKVLPVQNVYNSTVANIEDTLVQLITDAVGANSSADPIVGVDLAPEVKPEVNEEKEIVW